jgi:hypothetical protein
MDPLNVRQWNLNNSGMAEIIVRIGNWSYNMKGISSLSIVAEPDEQIEILSPDGSVLAKVPVQKVGGGGMPVNPLISGWDELHRATSFHRGPGSPLQYESYIKRGGS